MVAKYEPCSICEEYFEGVACTKDQCPVAKTKAEIKRLTVENSKLAETNNALNYQIDTWMPSKAIKEFAERLKSLYTGEPITDDMHCSIGVIKANIDGLVKEMTGEQK